MRKENKESKSVSIRAMTENERKELREWGEKERCRYNASIKIGGIDERGNYTALSYRWE